MAPLELFAGWNKRYPTNDTVLQDPYRKYWFLCEGEKTESFYFKKVVENKKQLGISTNVYIDLIEKTEDDSSRSNPKALLDLADKYLQGLIEKEKFDTDFDRIIIVFDADIYKGKKDVYLELLEDINSKGFLPAITNPSFELFLLLHKENANNDIIEPNKDKILQNEPVGTGKRKKKYIVKLFSDTYHINPKSNEKVGDLSNDLHIAIKEEKRINQNILNCLDMITSNIGKTMETIINNQ